MFLTDNVFPGNEEALSRANSAGGGWWLWPLRGPCARAQFVCEALQRWGTIPGAEESLCHVVHRLRTLFFPSKLLVDIVYFKNTYFSM